MDLKRYATGECRRSFATGHGRCRRHEPTLAARCERGWPLCRLQLGDHRVLDINPSLRFEALSRTAELEVRALEEERQATVVPHFWRIRHLDRMLQLVRDDGDATGLRACHISHHADVTYPASHRHVVIEVPMQ